MFQTGVISLLTALKVQSSELVNMKQMFIQLDTNQDGFLQVEELEAGMEKILGLMRASSHDWEELVHQLDTNRDGKIDYGEFITAAVNRTKLLNEENLRIAFTLFDKDGDGLISREELRAVFHGGLCHSPTQEDEQAIWDQIMQEVDKNQDNAISSSEFNQAMMEVIVQRSSSFL